jgi:uncharacterized protein (DUF885 family)
MATKKLRGTRCALPEGPPMLTRRAFAAGSAALALAPPLRAATSDADKAHAALMQQFAVTFLKRSPEEATGFGFDTGANAGLRSKLDDRSRAGRITDLAGVKQGQALLAKVDTKALGPAALLDQQVALFVLDTLADMLARPGFIDINLRPSPYVIQQMNGAYYWLPGFLGSEAPLATRADQADWLARLAVLAQALDQESDRIRHDATLGYIPPDFAIARTVKQVKALRDTPPLQTAMIGPALVRAKTAGLPDMSEQASAIFRGKVAPALDRQAAALEGLLPRASSIPGVWHLPDGEAYYAAALKANTTITVPAGDLHRDGLAQCRALGAEIDTLLKAQGFSKGTLAERMAALDADPRFRMTADDAGRAQIMAAANAAVAKATALLPNAFGNTSVAPLGVRRIDPAIEAGSPGAYYSGGGQGAGGNIFLNLAHPEELPLWRLPTLLHHEGVPGHHFQASVLASAGDVSLFRRIVRFSSWTEGWALYAEQVAGEMGVYDDNPFGRIGMLQSQLFRAARIVVDTGLHHERWGLQQAANWMMENAGELASSTDREVVRYAVYPGQACAFKVGANRIVAAREAARASMGPKFRVQDFHDLVLESGPVPLAVLESSIAHWSAGKK